MDRADEYECWHCGHISTVVIHDIDATVLFCPCCGSELEEKEEDDDEDGDEE